MRQFLRSLIASFDRDRFAIRRINAIRAELARVSDDQLRDVATRASSLLQFMAAAAVAASRILGQEMYDVQLRGALALHDDPASLPAETFDAACASTKEEKNNVAVRMNSATSMKRTEIRVIPSVRAIRFIRTVAPVDCAASKSPRRRSRRRRFPG